MKTSVCLAASLLVGAAAVLRLDGQDAPNNSLVQVLPFTDEYTVAVGRFDLEALDVPAWTNAVLDALPAYREALVEPLVQGSQPVQAWLSEFRAAGGRDLYVLVSLSYLSGEPPVLLVAPLPQGGAAERLQAVVGQIAGGLKATCRVVENCVVAAPQTVWDRMEHAGSGRPPANLQTAFAAAPAGVACLVVVPYAESARVVKELMPRLPAVVGGESSEVLMRGFRWLVASLQPPPEVGLRLTIKSESAADAGSLREVIVRALTALGSVSELRQHLPAWDRVQAMLTPTVIRDGLELRLDQASLVEFSQAFAPALQQSQAQAIQIQVVNNLKQIALALIMFADEHQDRFPAHLADTLPYLGSAEPLLLPGSPVRAPDDLRQQARVAQVKWLNQHGGFVLALPEATLKSLKEPMRQPLVYQKLAAGGDGPVGVAFADGHVELITREDLERRLK